METVEVVIRIPKEEYEKCKREEETIRAYQRQGFDGVSKYMYAILNGTVLPKGHGDLVDVNDLSLMTVHLIDGIFVCTASTIIEADKSDKVVENDGKE